MCSSDLEREACSYADRDHRFAKRDQDDESVSLGEVLGGDPPPVERNDGGTEVVDGKRDDPKSDAPVAGEKCRGYEEKCCE